MKKILILGLLLILFLSGCQIFKTEEQIAKDGLTADDVYGKLSQDLNKSCPQTIGDERNKCILDGIKNRTKYCLDIETGEFCQKITGHKMSEELPFIGPCNAAFPKASTFCSFSATILTLPHAFAWKCESYFEIDSKEYNQCIKNVFLIEGNQSIICEKQPELLERQPPLFQIGSYSIKTDEGIIEPGEIKRADCYIELTNAFDEQDFCNNLTGLLLERCKKTKAEKVIKEMNNCWMQNEFDCFNEVKQSEIESYCTSFSIYPISLSYAELNGVIGNTDDCYWKMAKHYNNPQYCEELNYLPKYFCKAQFEQSIDYCDTIEPSYETYPSDEFETLQNIDFYEKEHRAITSKSLCKIIIGLKNNDQTICDKVMEQEKTICQEILESSN